MSLLVFLADALRLAFKSLSERKLRAILTIIGVSIGPLALIAMVSVVKGYSSYVIEQLEALGQNLIVVMPSQGYELTDKDLDWLSNIPGVVKATPFYTAQGWARVGEKEVKVTLYATDLDVILRAITGLKIAAGRVPPRSSPIDALIGYYVAHTLDGRKVYDVGDVVAVKIVKVSEGRVETRTVTVVVDGVLDKFGSSPILNFDYTILLPLPAGKKLLRLKEWTGIILLVRSADLVANVTKIIRDRYGDMVSVVSFQGIARVVSNIARIMESITFTTSLAAFAVAVAGISATMITSVVERFREIGVLKALGFTDAQVITLILLEGLLISGIAAAIGVGLGAAAAYVLASRGLVMKGVTMTFVIKANPELSPTLIAQTIGVTLLVGLLGSILPAYKAAKIPPAVALRYE